MGEWTDAQDSLPSLPLLQQCVVHTSGPSLLAARDALRLLQQLDSSPLQLLHMDLQSISLLVSLPWLSWLASVSCENYALPPR